MSPRMESDTHASRLKVAEFIERLLRRRRPGRRVSTAKPRTLEALPSARLIAPHSLFFTLYTSLYFIPLWLVGTSGYGEGLVSQTGSDAKTLMNRIVGVYLAGTLSFLLGSWSTSKFAWMLGEKRPPTLTVTPIRVYPVDKILLTALITGFLISKIALISAGVYSSYAFDSSMMETPVWTTSMFFSESLAFASLIALFSNLRHNVFAFVALTMLNGINLLHGTRNFFVIAMTGALLYVYIRKRVSLVVMMLYALGGFTVAIFLAYVVYLYRQHSAFTDFSILSVLSPLTFESVFSQISLITVLGHPQMFDNFGNVNHLIQDVFVFTSPRFLVGNKESLLWTTRFGDLSPLGAFNGLAMGLLYFGYLLPLAYFSLGLAAGILRRLARDSYGAALYVYFCCDFVYRVQRDGYVIPAKMLINNIQILCILGILHLWMRRRSLRRASGLMPSANRTQTGGAYSA
jgi:hypothetical protein